MAKKTPRDPNAPKRSMSAYLLYQNAMREQFKALNPGMTFGQLAKYTSAMYAEMPPQEKGAWVARAEADKARYMHELANYVPPPGYDSKGDAILGLHKGANGGSYRSGKRKPERDSNAPKRNLSAYLLYQNAMREQFKLDNPGMTFGQLAKYTSHMYKNLTTDERATWEERSTQDKARYDRELAVYVPPPGYDARGTMVEEHRPRSRKKRSPRDPDQPKRASGAYVFFTNHMRPIIMQEFPNIKFTDLGRVMGERWRALTSDEKRRFEELADADKERFSKEIAIYNANRARKQQQQEKQVAEETTGQEAQDVAAHHDPYNNHLAHAHYYQQQSNDAASYAQASMAYDPNMYQGIYHAA